MSGTSELSAIAHPGHHLNLAAPVFDYQDLSAWAAEQKALGLTVGFTCGAFDLLHAGHVDYLQRARSSCDRLIVAVNSDESVRTYKNPLRPIIGERHRASLIAALACVDAVTIMRETRPAVLLEQIKPSFYIKGGDYSPENLRSASLVERNGGRVLLIPVEHEVSTTAIVARITEIAAYGEVSATAKPAGIAKIVFLDRDGTLIENVPFLNDPQQTRLLPGVPEGLKALEEAGYLLVVVTNQQGIGLGYFDYSTFVAVNSAMLRQLAPFGIRISRFYYCPHSHAEQCACRKPGTEMIEQGLRYFGARAEDCYLIGDSLVDVQAAERAGCHGILVGSASEAPPSSQRISDFRSAVQSILEPASGRS